MNIGRMIHIYIKYIYIYKNISMCARVCERVRLCVGVCKVELNAAVSAGLPPGYIIQRDGYLLAGWVSQEWVLTSDFGKESHKCVLTDDLLAG